MRVALAFLLFVLVFPSAALAQSGAQITISQPAEATTMDPGRSTQVLTVNYFINLYDTLTRWDNALKLQPGLATSWKQVNDTTWEFTLRQGVKFHDGTPLTAEDVKATLDRNLVPGKTVVNPGFTTIESVSIVNPSTIRIVTQKPDPLLLVRVAQMGAQILPARLTTDDGVKELARRPVGTGAYRFVEWVKDERLVMEANKDWWGWEGKKPSIERVIWKPIPDDFPRLVALEKGDVDIITNVPPDRSQGIADGRNTRLLMVPSTRIVNFGMNSTQAPLSDKRVRQALQYAVDVNAIIKSIYAGQGKPIVGERGGRGLRPQPRGQALPVRPGQGQAAPRRGGLCVRRRRRALRGHRHHGQRQGAARGDRQHVVQGGHPRRVEMMEMGARQRMLNDRAVPPNGMLLGNPQSTLLDVDGSLWRIWHPNGFNGKYWTGSQPGQRFHDLMEEARYTLDPKKRKALYAEAIEIRNEEKPSLDLFQEMVVYGTSKRVTFKPRADYRLIVAEMTLAGR